MKLFCFFPKRILIDPEFSFSDCAFPDILLLLKIWYIYLLLTFPEKLKQMKRVAGMFALLFFCAMVLSAQTKGTLSVSAVTCTAGGNYAPKNVIAIWVEDSSGKFVKTLLQYGTKRKTFLNNWGSATRAAGSSYNSTDAVTGATRTAFGTVYCNWDGTDFNKKLMADGEYRLRLELTDKNATGNVLTYPFNKGPKNQSMAPSAVSGFSAVSINWTTAKIPGVNKTPSGNDIQIFPNPGQGKFAVITKEILSLTVSSLTGRVVCISQNPTVDITDQPNGVYFITIKTSKETVTQKIIKN